MIGVVIVVVPLPRLADQPADRPGALGVEGRMGLGVGGKFGD